MATTTDQQQGTIQILILMLISWLKRAAEAIQNGVSSIRNGRPMEEQNEILIDATVVVIKKGVLDFNDYTASILDGFHELLQRRVSLQLVSATVGDPNLGGRGKVGKEALLEKWSRTNTQLKVGESVFKVRFRWDMSMGVPGAVIVKNNHPTEFYLKTVTLEAVPELYDFNICFVCNSWVYPAAKYDHDRVFFVNIPYLADQTPEPLGHYRKEELRQLRGDHVNRKLEEWDRVYGYAYYNDLGSPDNGPDHVRPVLGGSDVYPYPRRGRTGRPPTKTDPNTESRLPLLSLNIYVPRDERFGHLKMKDFLGNALKALVQAINPLLNTFFDETPYEFDSLDDVLKLYNEGIQMPESQISKNLKDIIPLEMIKELVKIDGKVLFKLPMPQVIQVDKSAWRTDEEFGREMLAGVNPVIISLLQEFPPVSKLDPNKYGNQNSSITAIQIAMNLEGLTVREAMKMNKLFILDHHDALLPYLTRINSTANKIYASRTILFLRYDGTLKPLAIELSLPHPDGENHGCVSKVFTPAKDGVEGSVWQLAKAYASVNDSGYHQLISHWLNTHATIEPFVIATHRQLSVMHPIHKLLSPHYRDTMNINALARQILINSGGVLEKTVFPERYAMELSSAVYKNWKLTDQGLPADLLKRGVAVEDPSSPNKLRLLIEDYPYAVDGLAVWSAIERWVEEYCSIYYTTNVAVQTDEELQQWWKEVKEVGHGDTKHETWWPELNTISNLTKTCTTIIWVASALHAAVNFGQYPYAGYLPNRPTISRRFMPEETTPEYKELEKNPDKFFMKTITSQLQTILGVSLIEVLSQHSSDEIYLGQRDTPQWTSDGRALEAFQRFGRELVGIEEKIMEMNRDERFKNRNGPVKVPYTLLYPSTSDRSGASGLTGKGIPNSVSI